MLSTTNVSENDENTLDNVPSNDGEMLVRALGGRRLTWCQSCEHRPAILSVKDMETGDVIVVCYGCRPQVVVDVLPRHDPELYPDCLACQEPDKYDDHCTNDPL